MEIEADIIVECGHGNPLSQQKLYDFYSPSMLALCMRYVQKKEDAEEVLIDGFVNIFRNIVLFDNKKSSFTTWIKSIMVHTAIDFLRFQSKYAKEQLMDVEMMEEYGLFADQEISQAAENEKSRDEYSLISIEPGTETAILMHYIQQMPEYMRLVFNMRLVDDFSNQEIAETLNIPQTTVRSRYSKALAWLNNKYLQGKKEKNI
ncbi:MAG: RNA polymerase sigma factor [Bacteroidales bacterium]|jgi:RNA polymerase sigma-70 factor (ECF subfamily)|nr:RNA polymerase sigma factor [Bacteroidales bacterium]